MLLDIYLEVGFLMNLWKLRTAAFVAAISVIGFAGPIARALAVAPSIFDTSFGRDGVSTIELPNEVSPSSLDDVQVDADGKLLTLLSVEAGVEGIRVAIGRRSADLVVDTSFGSNGNTDFINFHRDMFSGDIFKRSMLLQPDGKILLAGIEMTDDQKKITVRRYKANGQVDQSFGTQGVATIAEFPGKEFTSGPLLSVVASTGRIIIAINIDHGYGSQNYFYFFALDQSGKRDYSWGRGGGREIIPRPAGQSAKSELTNIAVLGNGSVIAVGSAYFDTDNPAGKRIVLIKLNHQGDLDGDFDGTTNVGNGIVNESFGFGDAYMTAITPLSNGNIVVAGAFGGYGGPWSYGAAQFNAIDGTPISTFGTNGFFDTGKSVVPGIDILPRRVLQTSSGDFIFSSGQLSTSSVISINSVGTNFNDYVWTIGTAKSSALQLLADGTFVMAGQSTDGGENSLIARMSSSGTPMTGPTGYKVNQYRFTPVNSEIVQSLPQSNGTIISLVDSSIPQMFSEYFARPVVARLTSTGTPDPNFGIGGFTKFFLTDTTINYTARDIVVQPDGKIVVLMQAIDDTEKRSMVVWRLLSDGRTDEDFGDGGINVISEVGTNLAPHSLILVENGKILLTGDLESNSVYESWFFQLESNGNADTTFRDSNDINGRVKITFGEYACNDCQVTQDLQGRALVRGTAIVSGQSRAVVARFLPVGTLDSSFSVDGFLTFPNSPSPIEWIADVRVTANEDIVVLAESYTPNYSSVLIRIRSDGTLDTSFNSTGLKHFNLQSSAAYAYSNSVAVTDTGYTVVGLIDEDDDSNSPNFAAVARIGLTGEFDGTFGINGISVVSSLGNAYLHHVASISDSYQLASGRVKDANGNNAGILIRLGSTPSTPSSTVPVTTVPATTIPVTTVPATTVPVTTVPVTTVPVTTVPAATVPVTTVPVVAAAVAPKIAQDATLSAESAPVKLVIAVSQATILKNMKLTVPKGGVATFSIAKSSARVCKVVKKQVMGTAIGTCRVSVTIKSKSKKSVTKSMAFKVSG